MAITVCMSTTLSLHTPSTYETLAHHHALHRPPRPFNADLIKADAVESCSSCTAKPPRDM
jgi:hypothetical protein